jgi:hypothetical protein
VQQLAVDEFEFELTISLLWTERSSPRAGTERSIAEIIFAAHAA